MTPQNVAKSSASKQLPSDGTSPRQFFNGGILNIQAAPRLNHHSSCPGVIINGTSFTGSHQ